MAQPGSGIGGGPKPMAYYDTSPGGSGGGGGGIARDMISRIRGQVMGNIAGMGPGGASAATPSSSYQFPTSEAAKPRMRGLAHGMDPEQAEAVLGHPSFLLPQLSRGADPNSPFYDTLESLPASQLGLLSTSGRKATAKNRLSQQINATGNAYTDAAKGSTPDFDTLVRDLTHAKKNSALGQAMKPPKVGSALDPTGGTGDYYTSPLTTASDTLSGLISAITQTSNLDDRVAGAYDDVGGYLIDKFGGKALKKSPAKMPMLNRVVGRKLFA